MTREAELIRSLAEDLALEILTSYTSPMTLTTLISAVWERQPFIWKSTATGQVRRFKN